MLDIKSRDVINGEEILVKMSNNHYVNIAENYTGVSPIELGTPLDPNLAQDTVEKILRHYENHPSIIEAKKLATTNESFIFLKAKIEDINKIINSLDLKKGTGTDGIPNKIIKTASKIVHSRLTHVLNQDMIKIVFLNLLKLSQ